MRFQVMGVVLLLLFYGCYFGKVISQKKKGIQTDQLGKGKAGFVKFIEVTMKVTTITVPVVELVSIAMNTSGMPLAVRYVGVVTAFVGILFFFCSVLAMGNSWRAGVPETDKTELITGGIYQISRNPAFLGFDFVYIGILCMFFNWVLFAVSAFAALMFHLQIVNVEEDFLIATFREEYLMYRKKVNRYIGRKWR